MLKLIPLKPFSHLFLVLLLVIAINGLHERAHAMPCGAGAARAALSDTGLSATDRSTHHSPDLPLQHQHDSDGCDGCDTCLDCACHAPLPVSPVLLGYHPILLDHGTSDPFQHLPEVYLSKFIPPQI